MKNDLKKLYSEIIKRHNDSPYHFVNKLTESKDVVRANNPICGDRFDIFPNFNEDKITQLHFHGFGCAISKASSSVLTKTLEGKSIDEALVICSSFMNLLDNGSSYTEELPNDFNAFTGVLDFPERYECAVLSWKEMKIFLELKKSEK